MVRISTTLALFSFTLVLHGQITIHSDDFNPLGAKGFQAMDTMLASNIQVGGLGMQTWDFTSLDEDVLTKFEFVEASSTPKGAEFPDANLCMVSDDSLAYVYLSFDDQALKLSGLFSKLPSPLDPNTILEVTFYYNPAQSLLRFPVGFGQAYDETIRQRVQLPGSVFGVPFDSVRFESTTEHIVSINAFGEMTTPLGSYDVLRSSELELSWDTTYIQVGGFWQVADAAAEPDSLINYNFWTNASGFAFPLVQISIDKSAGDIRTATWLKEFVLSTAEKADHVAVQVWPNPTSEQLFISLDEPRPGTIEIFDMNGRLFAMRSWDGHRTAIDVSRLPSGTHLLTLKDEGGRMITFKLFQKL